MSKQKKVGVFFMREIVFSKSFLDENFKDDWCQKLNIISNQINIFKIEIINGNFCLKEFKILSQNIKNAMIMWIDNTWIGEKKDSDIEKQYQLFYETLYDFLVICSKSNKRKLVNFSKNLLYKGTVYRYLGYSYHSSTSDKYIDIQYNNIYVSWSKNKNNNDIERQLYGKITRLTCEISDGIFGIDLSNLEIPRRSEKEVVFLTIKKYIKKIEYL